MGTIYQGQTPVMNSETASELLHKYIDSNTLDVSSETKEVLSKFTEIFQTLVEENKTLRDQNEKNKHKQRKEKPTRVQCEFITAKGTQCRKFCIDGKHSCKVHSKPLKCVKVVKQPRVKKLQCTGINIRGNPCRNKCLDGKTYCVKHDPNLPPVIKKVKRNKNREIPMHTHLPGHSPIGRCILCETHGDIFDPFILNHEIIETPGSSGFTIRSCIDKKNES